MDTIVQVLFLSCLVVMSVARPQGQGHVVYAAKPSVSPASYTPQGTHNGAAGGANAYQLSNRVGQQGGGYHNPAPQASGGGYQGGGAGGHQALAPHGYRAPAAAAPAPSGGFGGPGAAQGYQGGGGGGGGGGYSAGGGGGGYSAGGGIQFAGFSEKDVQTSLKDYDGSSYYGGSIEPHNFGYTVNDDYFGNRHGHNEVSDGSTTKGEYRVLLPDGRTQIVTYSADATSGFMAKVKYEGEASPYQPPADKVAGYQTQQGYNNPGRSAYKPQAAASQAAGQYTQAGSQQGQYNPQQGNH